MQIQFYRIGREINHRCNMFKETCLVDPRKTAGIPRRLGLEYPRSTVPAQRFLTWSKYIQSINKCNKHVKYECIERKRKWFWEFWHKNHWIWSCGWKDMNFWNFGAIFVDFSEAEDLFVIIFRISDWFEKFVDRGLNLENPRGLSAKPAKLGPRVEFPKVQGPYCKISEISE
jgi:hypothetical protein